MTVKETTLLSIKEYMKYRSVIPVIEDSRWWLRSSGSCRVYAAYVNFGGFINGSGLHVANDFAIRPALKFNLDVHDSLFWYKPEKLIGTKIEYGKYKWTILNAEFGELYILCDDCVSKHCFDPESNDWNTSELKQWLKAEGLGLITY